MALEIRLFGELAIVRDGRALPLPASKKTRALVAYLAATARPQLREKLCTLLWDGPDDPRAALRWSLTKLRPLVDDASATRMVADRDRVELVAPGLVDLHAVRAAVPGGTPAGVARASVEALAAIAPLVRGELLEGLDLPDCFRFDEWLRGERETTRRLATAILASLVERDAPDALAHARAWVALDPLVEAAHLAVIRLLSERGRKSEALAQYTSCARIFERELGHGPSRALERIRMHLDVAVPAPVALPESPSALPITPLVGRTAELAALATLLADPPGTAMSLVLGDPGIGKTRLLDELARLARDRGFEVLRGRGVEAEQVRPYGAWLDALDGVADHPFRDRSNEADRATLFEAFATWLVARTQTRAVCVIVDDLQWIDEATAALLHHVARRARGLRIACGARPGELADNQAALRVVRGLTRERAIQQIGLSPLAADDIVALAAALAPGVDGARVFAESGGHPLFAVEIAHALARGDTEWSSLDALLADRLDLLEGTAGDLVPWLAALGTATSADVLASVTGHTLAELDRAIRELERRAIVHAVGSEWDFVHDLVRAAAYRAISEPRRRLLHLQLARTLASLPDPDGERAGAVAHHAGLGDDSALCAASSHTAAERALRLFAPEEAAAIADRGLAHANRLAGVARSRLQIDLLTVALGADVRGTRRAEIGRALERAIVDAQAAGLHGEAARGFNELSHIPFRTNDLATARALSIDAARNVRDADAATRARTLAFSAQCIALIGREMAEAEQLAREAAELVGDQPLEAPTLPCALALIRNHQGETGAALMLFERAAKVAERSGAWWQVAQAGSFSALIELTAGHHREALAWCEVVAANAGRLADSSELAFAAVLAVLARRGLGDAIAEAELDAALGALRRMDAPMLMTTALVAVGEAAFARGAVTEAAAVIDEAIAEAIRSERESQIVIARYLAARVAAATGDRRGADGQIAAVAQIDPGPLSARAREAYGALVDALAV